MAQPFLLLITHWILVLYGNIIVPYEFSPILVDFNHAQSYCKQTYNSSLAQVFTSQQIEIVSKLCAFNGIANCWISSKISNNYTHPISNEYCLEITANVNTTQSKLNNIACNLFRHPICNIAESNGLLNRY